MSWGAYSNLTFSQSLDTILDKSDLDKMDIQEKTSLMKVGVNISNNLVNTIYLPNIGYCKQIHDYDPSKSISIDFKDKTLRNIDIFVTDQRYSTNYKLDYETQVG